MKLRRKIFTLALSAVLATGCAVNSPIKKYENGNFRAGLNYRGSYSPTYYTLKNKETRTVPVHHYDSMFLSGATDTEAKGGFDFLMGSVGLEGAVGVEKFSIIGGIDALLDFSSLKSSQGTRLFFYDWKQQVSDVRPAENGSFVYDRFDKSIISPSPFIGFRAKPFEKLTIEAECGFPYLTVNEEWGHHRWNEEEKIGNERDAAWGIRPSVGFLWNFGDKDEDFKVGLKWVYEQYKFEKLGSLTGNSIMLNFENKW